MKEENINMIAKFLSQCDHITINQKKRFESIFREYNPDERVSFNSINIASILNLFIMDPNVSYSHLVRYMNDIRNILSRIIHMNNTDTKIPREWKCSDNLYTQYKNFIDRDGNSVYLYLHNNIFMKTKDNNSGFNSYINDDNENSNYFKLLYNRIKHYLIDLEKIKGSNYSKYNNKYSNIYMKYHFIGLLYEIVNSINDLKDSQSEITSDANDLFQSLQKRDEDLIDDMIETLSQFFMDLIIHILEQHYDPSWLFLNEQKLDLANRLSKQKEREKQIIVDKLSKSSLSKEERFAMIQKQKMGISSWHHECANERSEYIKSDEYTQHNDDERYERMKEIQSQGNIELDVLNSQNDEIEDIPQSAIIIQEGEDNIQDIEIDEEDENYQNEYLDDEQEQQYNE